MLQFIVLGLVPGTNFQINFFVWLGTVAAGTALLCIGYRFHRRQTIRFFLIRLSLMNTIRHQRA